jgi:hypothetical protein
MASYTYLTAGTLGDLFGFLEKVESFGETASLPNVPSPGRIYIDPSWHATIGYGFALDGQLQYNRNGALINATALGAVLDAMTFTSSQPVTLVGGQTVTYSDANVFAAAAEAAEAMGTTAPSATEIVQYFSGLIQKYESYGQGQLQTYLDEALQDFYLGVVPTGTGPPPTPKDPPPVTFTMTPAEAGTALLNVIEGGTLQEATGGVPIVGKSPDLLNVLQAHGVPYISGELQGADAASPQWEALVAAYYNGGLGGASQGLADSDPAQAWYDLRYVVNHPLSAANNTANGIAVRDYLQSQMFGLNGASSGDSWAQAIQDYEMLTEHRATIISFEQRFRANPDGPNPYAAPSNSPLYQATALPGQMNTSYNYSSGTRSGTVSWIASSKTGSRELPGAVSWSGDPLRLSVEA